MFLEEQLLSTFRTSAMTVPTYTAADDAESCVSSDSATECQLFKMSDGENGIVSSGICMLFINGITSIFKIQFLPGLSLITSVSVFLRA